MPEPLFTEGLSLLRYGVRVCEDKDILIPDHALASSCNGAAIELPKEKALAYLRGETFPLSAEDGFRVVAYQGIPLGFVKMVRGVAKNHYPKGLRRCY